MNRIKLMLSISLLSFTAISLAVLVVKETREPGPASVAQNNATQTQDCIRVYYFYGNVRCETCRKIEAYSKEAVSSAFAAELKDGRIQWFAINTDKPENTHFAKEYELVTRSVIISDIRNGKQTRWKNLVEIWDKVDNKNDFSSYVVSEIRAYLGGETK